MTINELKVTIVIPVYNGEKYIKEAIDSAINQTYENLEIIVINDGSSDNTDSIVTSYGNRVKYYKKENGGVSTALNLAISKMTGNYFSWLSHDDLYLPMKIEKEIDYLITNDLIDKSFIVYSNYYLIDSNSRIISEIIMDHNMLEKKAEYSLLRGAVNGNTLLIPKVAFEKYGLFDEKLSCTQDYMLWHKMQNTYDFIHIPQTLICSRFHIDQQSNKNPKMVTEGDALWTMMVESISEENKEKLETSEYLYYFNMRNFLKSTPYKITEEYCSSMMANIRNKKSKAIDLTKILVSVIIPFYNRPKETIRAIKSVLLQTHKNYEIILINDGSTEDLFSLKEFIKDKSNISFINLKINVGPAGARNEGIKYSKGEYIAFLDSDDEFLPEKIEIQLFEMRISDSIISHTSYIRKMDNQEVLVNTGIDCGDIKRKIIYNCQIATPTVMLNKKFIIENKLSFNSDIRIGEDVCFWLTILKETSLIGIEKPLSIVNTSKENSAYNYDMQLEGIKNILKFLLNDNYYSQYDLEISNLAESYSHYAKKEDIIHYQDLPQSYYQRIKNSIKNYGYLITLKKILYKLLKVPYVCNS